MALNFADRIAVRAVLVPRCTAAVSSYALYLLGKSDATVAQKAWAREAVRAPGRFGDDVSWHFLGNQAFIDNGSSITDADLDYVVQTAVNAHFIQAS